MAHIFAEGERTRDVMINENVSFESLLLPPKILEGLKADGFKRPSPIQLRAIPVGRCGFDIVMRSKSGTGKTLVFTVLAIESVDVTRDAVQVLILTPTREIATQIRDVIRKIGVYFEELKVESFIGGLPVEEDKKNLVGCHVAIGAPGRVKHLMKSGFLKTERVKLFVLDEADKLMDQNFQADINQIFHQLPAKKQVIASSATYPEQLDTFLARYMHCPSYISADADGPLLLGLKQFVCVAKSNANIVQQLKTKSERLNEILSKVSFTQCLVFTNYQTRAESVSNLLNQKGWNSAFVSAAQEQKKRLEAVDNLKKFNCRILLSTDLTARGIDAANVDLVINYDVPYDAATYLHRMGRAGRYGSKGVCITICSSEKETREFRHIIAVIAGPGAAVAKLEQIPADLSNCDYQAFEMISSELDEGANINRANADVKDSVLNLKSSTNKAVKAKKSKKNSAELDFDPETARAVLNNEQEQDINAEVTKMGLFSLLQSIDAVKSGEPEESDEEFKEETATLEAEKTSRNDVLQRNICLYNITKLLQEGQKSAGDVSNEVVDSVKNYLEKHEAITNRKIETIEEQVKNVPTEELSENLGKYVDRSYKPEVDILDDHSVLENVFEIAYAHACDDNTKHWLLHFSENLQDQFYEFCNPPCSPSSSSESDCGEDAEEAEEEEEEEEEEAPTRISRHEHVSREAPGIELQNVPQEGQETDFAEQFSSYFAELGQSLESTALTFEDLASFDGWFYYDWQTQVNNIREYVRQNIYVHEMNEFQKSQMNRKTD